MASTARAEQDCQEFQDSPEDLEAKIQQLAEWVRNSSHMIAFTGAGVSTACGIADFRSGLDTILETGPGAWTLAAAKKPVTANHHEKALSATPSATHMTFVELLKQGTLKHLISQNTDGLHRRSGVAPEHISELHGNSNLEICKSCKWEGMRDFKVRTAKPAKEHVTGRSCPSCGGDLFDTHVNFGESLPVKALRSAERHAGKADLCLAMGSSLTVSPANDFPRQVAEHGRLCIVNLQKTPLDGEAQLRIYARCDDVSKRLMQVLGHDIPPFVLERHVVLKAETEQVEGVERRVLSVRGVDVDGKPMDLLSSARLLHRENDLTLARQTSPVSWFLPPSDGSPLSLHLVLGFMGHYSEPVLPLRFEIADPDAPAHVVMNLRLDVNSPDAQWQVSTVDGQAHAASPSLLQYLAPSLFGTPEPAEMRPVNFRLVSVHEPPLCLLRVAQLKQRLKQLGIDTAGCREKGELVSLLLAASSGAQVDKDTVPTS